MKTHEGQGVKSWPVFSSIVVAVAVATMVALGLWQLDRLTEKREYIALVEANRNKPLIAYPALAPVRSAELFRPSSVMCLEVTDWRILAGRSAAGQSGQRYIAECRTGAEGPGALVTVGVKANLDRNPQWQGGLVRGIVTEEPDQRSLFARALGKSQPLRPMLVATDRIAGFERPATPSPEDIPNNHLAYAVQWFFFAAVAAIIFLLAVRSRRREG